MTPPAMVSPAGITELGWALFPFLWVHLVHSAHDHPLNPLLTAPVTAAMVARETTTLLATSTHGRSVLRPSPVYRDARSWPSRCRWSARDAAAAGVSSYAANKSCNRYDTRLAAGVRPPRVFTAL